MNSAICTQCRIALRQRLQAPRGSRRHSPRSIEACKRSRAMSSSARASFRDLSSTGSTRAQPSPQEILSEPAWSVRSLLPPSEPSASSKSELEAELTPPTLRHLLRLSALPPPATTQEEETMLSTLRSQLHFVRDIQRVDTTGVRPLVSIRDETVAGVEEQTIRLDTLREALDGEDVIGHSRRPRRRREEGKRNQVKGVEDWDVLGGAGMKAGQYFVVRSGEGNTSE